MPSLLDALSDSENTIDLHDENLITPIHEFLEINPEKRLITIPESEQLFGVYGENKVEVKYFKCPRIILNDIDLYECYIFINYISASGKIGYIQVDTVVLDETENYIIFTWELTRNVFDKNIDTDIYFSISAKQYLEDKEPVFFTRKAKGNLYETIYAEEQITEQYADIILQLLAEMNGLKQIATPEAMQDYVDDWLKENPQKIGGQPVPAKSASEIQNTQTLYLYMGDGETIDGVSYERGYTYYYSEKTKKWIKGIYYGLIEDMLVSRTSGTEIIVKGGEDAPLGDFNLYGKGEQKEYSGKNKLNTSGLKQMTINGVTYTPVYDDNGMLLYVEASGTATANSYYAISTFDYTEDCYLSGSPEGASANTYRLFDDVLQRYDYGEGVLINSGSTGKVYCMVISGVTVNKIRFKPMIRLASVTDPTYEPYVGGIPSPNPDFPQEIVNVGHKSRQLFDKATGVMKGLFVGSEDKVVTASGTATSIKVKVKPNTQYTISRIVTSRFVLIEFENEPIEGDIGINYTNKNTFTTGNTTKYIMLYFHSALYDTIPVDEVIDSIMVNEGSKALPWEPFTDKYVLPLKMIGKNWLENIAKSTTKNGVTFTINKDKSVTVNGNATEDTYFKINSFEYGEGSYILTGTPSSGSISTYYVYDDTLKKYDVGNGVEIEGEQKGDIYIKIPSGVQMSNITFHPMIRPVSVEDSTYEPYKEHTEFIELDEPLRATKDGSIRDKLFWDGTVDRKIYNWILDSKFVVHTYNDDGSAWVYVPKTGMIGSSKVLSNRFRASNDMRISTTGITCRIPSSAGIYISDDTAFREFVTDNETYIQYPLATPITETLPESEIAKLRRLQTFNPTTIITADGGEMELMYAKENDAWKYILQNFVFKSEYDDLKARVLILEQNMLN